MYECELLALELNQCDRPASAKDVVPLSGDDRKDGRRIKASRILFYLEIDDD